ncbi:VCBS repeat-containing protein [Streptomyces sp. ISL-11]|uniref:FG-GAP repeat domain-containing protein n=1 Tax=Streptomyces sp. ISL-11 TaxID=2819174 RepID=UPI001BECB1FC|nr:VCBS repeat-containing protein [Streptomyces sp. ISL-11]MBT2387722.1 VCBS repeat-containing protein [Streptomyces sp. ISL-11]
MAHLSGRTRGRALRRLATAAIATALVGTTAGQALADGHAPSPAASTAKRSAKLSADTSAKHRSEALRGEAKSGDYPKSGAQAPQAAPRLAAPRKGVKADGPTAEAPFFPLSAVNNADSNELYFYWPDGKGGITPREYVTNGWEKINAAARVDHNRDGVSESLYIRDAAQNVVYATEDSANVVADDWGQYDQFMSPGNLGGGGEADILVRDREGVLWLYLAYSDGTLTGRKKVGPGWGQFTEIAGRGDLTGDGKTDIVARDKDGVLWLYKGTGDYTKPFEARQRVGGGWNQFNKLVGTGDVDMDGRADLVARDNDGALWLYRGTGNASQPYDYKVKIGNSGWNQFRMLF